MCHAPRATRNAIVCWPSRLQGATGLLTPVLSRAIRRLALNTKQAGKDYYKGTGTGAMGRHTKYGGYVIQFKKVRTYVCPDLSDFSVSPGPAP